MPAKPPIMPNRLLELRKTRRMSQNRLAELAGTTHTTISRLERGEIDLGSYWVLTFARLLEVHPGELFRPLPPAAELAARVPPSARETWMRLGEELAKAA